MNFKDVLKFDIKHKSKHKLITLGYAVAIMAAFIVSLTNNNYVEASVSKSERLDYIMIENNVVSNLSNPETIYPESSVENIKSLFDMVNTLVRERKEAKTITVEKGDTLISVLMNLGLNREQANDVYYKFNAQKYDPRDLRIGQKITALTTIDSQTGALMKVNFITLEPQAGERLIAQMEEDGEYKVRREKDEMIEEVNSATGSISGTLSHSMQNQGVPAAIVYKFIQIFANSVDFRRDVRKGDKFEIIYENKISPDGKIVKTGDIIYAALILRKDKLALYRFEHSKGNADYYTEKGLAMKKTLRKVPLNVKYRISSPFGKRRHPIFKDLRIHWGVDYAAPMGSPILAGGDGVVQVAKYNGAYGNYIKIRHNSEFSTAYGHMKGFAKGIRPGVRVKQGQLIGYVGSTGRSTGPHVHYEVVQNGRRVNPRTIKASAGENLAGAKLKQFKKMVAEVQSSYKSMFAQNDPAKVASK